MNIRYSYEYSCETRVFFLTPPCKFSAYFFANKHAGKPGGPPAMTFYLLYVSTNDWLHSIGDVRIYIDANAPGSAQTVVVLGEGKTDS